MNKRDAEKARKRMTKAVELFQHYVATYSKQAYFKDYSDRIFLDDMLYGIGLALQTDTPTDYSGPGGYERFKEHLRRHLGAQTVTHE
jgi:hypothetical protein